MTTAKSTAAGRFQPGKSGNPKGRPAGRSEVTKARAAIAQAVPDLLEVLTAQAMHGDVQAARLLLERAIPPLRPVEAAQAVAMPGETLTEKAHAVLAAVAAGVLSPSQGSALVQAIGQVGRIAELDDLERRIKALEAGA